MPPIFPNNDLHVFLHKNVLNLDYVPDRLIARDQQIQNVAGVIQNVFRGGCLDNALIFGKTGTGKTVVVKYVVSKMKERAKEDSLNIKSAFISCKKSNTTVRIIKEIILHLTPDITVKHGLSASDYYDMLWDVLNMNDMSVVVVLDEIDMLHDQSILYTLSRAAENQFINHGISIGVIGTTNDINFKKQLTPSTLSSFGQVSFVFPPYDAHQLAEILNDRVALAFQPNTLHPATIPLCAALSAQEHGDARIALKLLDKSGDVAEQNKTNMVTEDHVRAAYKSLHQDWAQEVAKTLPLHSKLVLLSIIHNTRGGTTATTGDVLQYYLELCAGRGLAALGRSSVSTLISDLEIMGFINATIQSKHRRGRTRIISLSSVASKLELMLLNSLAGM